MTRTIILIHGLWMTPLSWEHWIEHYTRQGYNVIAPSWPGLEAGVEALRRNPSPLSVLDASTIIDHYARIIRSLEEPPIIMGHSFGGAFVQVLLHQGLGSAGVAIDSAATKGVLSLPLSTLKSSAGVLANPINFKRAVPISKQQFAYAFGNTMTQAESDEAYMRYSIPAAAHVLFEGALANFLPGSAFAVDYKTHLRAPLFFIAGGKDHVIPASTNRANIRKYAGSRAITELHEFPDRSHFTLGERGWEAVADMSLNWALQHTGRGGTPPIKLVTDAA